MNSFTFLYKTFIIITLSHYLIISGVISAPSGDNESPQTPFDQSKTVIGEPGLAHKLPNSGPYGDLPKVYVFDQKFDWERPGGMRVYDANGVVSFIITNKVNGQDIGRSFVIQHPPEMGGHELIRVNFVNKISSFILIS